MARPNTYNHEVAEQICQALSTSERGLREVCEAPEFPNVSTVWRWLCKYPDFWDMYTKARDFQTELMYDELDRIIDEDLPDNAAMAMAEVQRRKLKVDTMKFKLAKLQPKRFGDNRNMNVDVKVRHQLSAEQFSRLLETAAKTDEAQDVEDIEHEEIE